MRDRIIECHKGYRKIIKEMNQALITVETSPEHIRSMATVQQTFLEMVDWEK